MGLETLPSMLCDNDHRLQCNLLAEENLTFDIALKTAKVVETAERDLRGMQDPSSKGHTSSVLGTSLFCFYFCLFFFPAILFFCIYFAQYFAHQQSILPCSYCTNLKINNK